MINSLNACYYLVFFDVILNKLPSYYLPTKINYMRSSGEDFSFYSIS